MSASDEGQEYILFSWGANSYGQLGLGHTEDKLLPSAVQIETSKARTLKQITGGGGHTILLTTEGSVLVCGWNKNGQLGLPPPDSEPPLVGGVEVLLPRPLPNQQWRVEKVACGWNHTLVLIEKGGLMAWGSNIFGQLGSPDIEKQSAIPVPLSSEYLGGSSVSDMSAGLRHSIAVTEGGQVFGWGDGRKGQLGLGKKELVIHRQPKSITCSQFCVGKIIAVSAGSYHSTALGEDGSLLSWGLNQHGQCGVGPLTNELKSLGEDVFKMSESGHICNVYSPLRVCDLPSPLAEVHCGWSHTLVVTHDRKVLAWGRADYEQLGQGSLGSSEAKESLSWSYVPVEISLLRGTEQIACGSEHTIAINASKKTVSFGWNEHGMCGTGDEVNVKLPTEVSKLAACGECVLVGAGAGHSMALIKTTR